MRANECEKIDNSATLTRRQALQAVAGLTGASLLPFSSEAKPSSKHPTAWPADSDFTDLVKSRLRPFNDEWRFHRGDAVGADAPSFDDSAWRTLDVPHDWSIEDLPTTADGDKGAIWTDGTNPLRVGPFDAYQSEGQISTGWTVGGIGWYRKAFQSPSPKGETTELRFEGVYMNCDVWLNGAHLGNHPYGLHTVHLRHYAALERRHKHRRLAYQQLRP